jgi:signal transduction histidine kinase/tellurite resistance protein
MAPRTYTFFIALLAVSCLFAGCSEKEDDREKLRELRFLEGTEKLSATRRLQILDSMAPIIKVREQDSLNRQMMRLIAFRYFFDGEYDKHKDIMHGFYKTAVEKKDSVVMAYSLYNIGSCFEAENQADSALYYYLNAGKVYRTVKDSANMAQTAHSVACILFTQGNYAEAETEEIKALSYFRKTDNNEYIINGYTVLGATLSEMKSYPQALKYYQRAFDETAGMKRAGFTMDEIRSKQRNIYGNIGVLYGAKGDHEKSLQYYDKALALPGYERYEYAVMIANRGYAKMMLDKDEDEYTGDLWESLRILDSLDEPITILETKKSIARHYLKKQDTLKSVTYLREIYAEAKANKSNYDMLESLSLLTLNDKQNTFKYSQLYFKLNDSLQQAERSMRNKFARIAYETDSIERQNRSLSRRFNYTIVAFIAVLAIVLGLLIILRLKSRNKELLYIQGQQQANEKIYNLLLEQEAETEEAKIKERNRLAMELHDGVMNRIFTTRFNLMQLKDGQEDKKKLLVRELEETQDELRKISHDLKEGFLPENESFADALKKLVERQQEPGGPVFDLYIDKFINWNDVSPECRVALFRITHEACTNARKHSWATNCNIALMAHGQHIKLRIWDDGKGFDPKKVKDGIGLRNMRERVLALGGTFVSTSSAGSGAVLDIIV